MHAENEGMQMTLLECNMWFLSYSSVPNIQQLCTPHNSNGFQGIGNGIPLGAVVTTPEIAQVLTRRNYFNTFGGNPVCTAGGLAVLRVLEKENLQHNALLVGSYLKDRLKALQQKHESNPSATPYLCFGFSIHLKLKRLYLEAIDWFLQSQAMSEEGG